MAEALALKYRPKTFTDLVGQMPVAVVLRQMVRKKKIPAGLLFEGASGTGKTTTARILAAALNCEAPAVDTGLVPCGTCPSDKAIQDGTSLDVVEIDAASNGLVDDIRALRSQVQYSVGGQYRVVILDEAHSMSAAAFDALLKTLEEPPAATVFLLLTTEPGRLPRTVLNRLMPFTFRRLAITDIVGRLRHICEQEQKTVDPELLAVLAERADGALRNAVMSLDQALSADIHTLDAYADIIGDRDYAPALASALAAGDIAASYNLVDQAVAQSGDPNVIVRDLVATYKDILTIQAGGVCTRQGEALNQRTHLANQLDAVTVVAVMRILWDYKTRFRVSDDPRTGIDLAVALIADAHGATRPATSPPAPAAPRKLSLADMKAMKP